MFNSIAPCSLERGPDQPDVGPARLRPPWPPGQTDLFRKIKDPYIDYTTQLGGDLGLKHIQYLVQTCALL